MTIFWSNLGPFSSRLGNRWQCWKKNTKSESCRERLFLSENFLTVFMLDMNVASSGRCVTMDYCVFLTGGSLFGTTNCWNCILYKVFTCAIHELWLIRVITVQLEVLIQHLDVSIVRIWAPCLSCPLSASFHICNNNTLMHKS